MSADSREADLRSSASICGWPRRTALRSSPFLIALQTGFGWTRGHTIGVVLGSLACGLLSIRYGHHFLELLLRLFRRW
jgi:hypothetical protein